MPSNSHILDYLTYYAAFAQAPRFAVLIDGRWGIGKTHLVETFLGRVRTTEFKAVYVSLNGLKSSAEIDRELFRASYAVLGNKFFEAAAGIAKSGLKWWQGISLDVDLMRLINRFSADLYVFDDLERCDMPIAQTLGYINAFVEQGGRKVVIVANEAEIRDSEDYRRIREKVIGQTLVFQPAIDDALAAFLAGIQFEPARRFLSAKVDVIAAIHRQAGLDNLRVLQQALWDFARFFEALEDRHRADDVAMTAMLRLLMALSMDVRSNRLSSKDLKGRQSAIVLAYMGRHQGEESSPLLLSYERYPGADIDSMAISDTVITALLIDGIVDQDAIRADLDASRFFVNVADEPPWRTLWYGVERTDEEVAGALASVEAAFGQRDFTVPGEILHVFGLRLKFARIGALPLSVHTVVCECEHYVDDLYTQKRLVPAATRYGIAELYETAYDGLGIAGSETGEFKALAKHLAAKQAQAAADEYPVQAEALLDTLKEDPLRFIEEVAPGMGRDSGFARVPVLAQIDPGAFATAILALRPDVQRKVLKALAGRYNHGMLQGDLAPELTWAQAVRAALAAEIPAMPPYGQYRMTLFLDQSFGQVPEMTPPTTPPAAAAAPPALP
ncbi:P-loop NTPase fold protein [Methylobacterium sp. OT2]|uniref:P-loop NTPase fold protein n=1 Tax=Methylobacterium sp. OT2 TaxID=2813779 RepID=UPI00197C0921|nr:P-loop NTPase fold protein [Methylobacterium sp. OT2]MBN4096052.1 hypothetical protein [Methylobacterium sp. OT2]